MQYLQQSPNQEVSNTSHFGLVSASLNRFDAESECVAGGTQCVEIIHLIESEQQLHAVNF